MARSEQTSKLLASLAGKDKEPDSSNRRKLIAGVRSAFESGDDDELGEALDAYVGDFIDDTEG
jgi:hypothetical protein